MPVASLLIIEDDAAIRRGLVDALTLHGYATREAGDGRSGLAAALAAGSPTAAGLDLVLLDVMLPTGPHSVDGLGVLKELRVSRPTLPVILLTALGEEADRVRGLRLGADDYIVKPFSIAELLARIEAVLRRSAGRTMALATLEIQGRRVDFDRREVVHADGTRDALTARECELLMYLSAHRGKAVSREELLQHVWGLGPAGTGGPHTRTVDMAVARVRTQLRDGDPPTMIVTVRGKGYMLGEVTRH